MEENLPPGFRFHPTDEELITCYLSNKVSDFAFSSRAIADVDLNKCEPWDLPAKASMGEKEWYFFSLRDRKYPTGMRTNRATEAGYWKTTGKDKEIFRGGVLVGMKKTLVFYRGRAPKGEKTNWVMHEYRLESKLAFKTTKEEWVVCRVFQKSATVKKPPQTPTSPQSLGSPCDTNTINANELGDIELSNFSNSSNNNVSSSSMMLNNLISSQHFMHLSGTTTDNFTANVLNWNNAIREAAATSLPPLTSWPSSTNLGINTPFLLRALQLGNLQQQQREETLTSNPSDHHYSFLGPQSAGMMISNNNLFGNNFMGSSNLGAGSSSSRVNLDHTGAPQEQPFNLDSNLW